MNNKMNLPILLALVGILGVSSYDTFYPDPPPPVEETPSWEYGIQAVADTTFEADMNVLGKERWELVFARRASGEGDVMMYECIFKRQTEKTHGQ